VDQDTHTVSGTHLYADNGTYTVTVTVTDNNTGVGSNTLTVTVNNVGPTVEAGADQTVNEGQTVSLAPATFNDLGTLDTHTATIDWGDGTAVEAGIVSESPFGPPGSALGADGTVSGSHVYADNGVYTVTVTVTDDEGALDSDTLTVTVKTAPVAIDDAYATNEDADLVIAAPGVLGNDSDADGDPMTAVVDVGPSNGILTLYADGSFEYTPNADYNGPDSFTYHANDGELNSNIATVTITVNPINDAPVLAEIGDKIAIEGDLLTFTANATDSDVPANALQFSLIDAPAGAIIDSVTGVFTWTPSENQGPGNYELTIRVTDDGTPNLYREETIAIAVCVFNVPEGTTLDVNSIKNPSAGDFPVGVEAPYDFFEFTITGVATGGATTVTLILPENISSYYKYGPTPDNTADHWYEFMYDGQTGAVISGNVVTLHFVDGLRGDYDITANGTIVDPGGPVLQTPKRFSLPMATDKRLNYVYDTVDTIFAPSLYTDGNDPFIVPESVYDFSPITTDLYPESVGVVPPPDPEHARIVRILRDEDGIRLANLKVLAADIPMPITEEEMRMPLSEELEAAITTIENDIMNTTYASAREWRQALFDYISRLIFEDGWSAQRAIAYAIEIYGPTPREIGGQKAALYITVKLNQMFPDGGAG